MLKKGLVIKVLGNQARVAVVRNSACGGNCDHCNSCETQNLFIDVDNEVDAKVGDVVEVEGLEENVIRFSLILYTIPLVFFVISMIISYYILNGKTSNVELLAFGIGIIFLGISYFILRSIDKKYQRNDLIKINKIIGGIK